MTSPAAATPAPKAAVTNGLRTLPTRTIAFFSGTVGFVVKIVLLSIVNAFGVWGIVILAHRDEWTAVGFVVAATAVIDFVYMSPRAVPAKFLIPGTFFLVCFQVIPILYTIDVAFTNYSTGHILNKAAAIHQIRQVTLAETGNGKT